MALRVHHINCGSMCPFGGPLMDGASRGVLGHLICHCLLIESEQGLVLVDTGFGAADVRDPFPRLSKLFVDLLNVELDERYTALFELRRLGFKPEDVRHIVLTHLDFDHAGGLADFPLAKVHLMAAEAEVAEARRGFVARRRYRPDQWGDTARWQTYSPAGEKWFGFDCVRSPDGLPPEILLVPLSGHTRGHTGVAVQTQDGWLFDAGDAYFHHAELSPDKRRCPPGLRAYQTLMEQNRKKRLWNQERVRALSADPRAPVTIFCSHDVTEYETLTGRAAKRPN